MNACWVNFFVKMYCIKGETNPDQPCLILLRIRQKNLDTYMYYVSTFVSIFIVFNIFLILCI